MKGGGRRSKKAEEMEVQVKDWSLRVIGEKYLSPLARKGISSVAI
jgi:hypothetical protein